MNNKKLIIIVLLILFVTLFSFVNVNAEEIDYNNTIVIELGSINYTYSNYGLSGATWKTYISYLKHLGIYDFGYANNYVIWKSVILLDRTGAPVLIDDSIKPGANTVYQTEQVWSYDGSGYKINSLLHGITFGDLIENYSYYLEIRYNAYGSNPMVFWSSYPLITSESIVVTPYDYVKDIYYHQDLDYTCTHIWQLSGYVYPTCVLTGTAEYECDICGEIKTEELPIDNYAHRFIVIDFIEPTCLLSGEETQECDYCGLTQTVDISPLGHNFSAPTCTEAGCCTRDGCDEIGSSALGHTLGPLGRCKVCGEWWPESGDSDADKETFADKAKEAIDDFTEIFENAYDDLKTGISNFMAPLKAIAGVALLLIILEIYNKIVSPVVKIVKTVVKKVKKQINKKRK